MDWKALWGHTALVRAAQAQAAVARYFLGAIGVPPVGKYKWEQAFAAFLAVREE